ncbi:LysR family transcriptional regulator [Polaromonas sp. C04]|uniref:LysR family transcriptional regulator n=1 Tax=Polaromonas sp. C04 TaxID=1945857 RepID=UPI00098675D6|nr:LysR family transcriptional regulator [Polaromonas sp. C04]OOG58800.1 LysR family transcriptional regulator [Polaromonas sp. C04]
MTLVQLRHLITLAETGSFSRAAQAVFLTQPALSRSIRALEDELQTPLFDRIGRRIELTPVGQMTLDRARHLVLDADELRAGAARLEDGLSGTLRIGLGSGPGAMLMTPLLLHIAQERPRLHVEISRAGTELLAQALRARSLDAMVVDVRSLRAAPDLRVDSVQEMRGTFMVRRGHPLARLRSGVTFEAIARYPIASTPLSDEVAKVLIEHYGAQAHPDQCVTLQCEELTSLVEVARRSDAVLLAIRAAAPELVELKTVPPLNATARFGIVTLARRTQAPALSAVRTLVQRLLQDAPAL